MITEENYNNEEMEEVIVPLELEDGKVMDCHVIAIFDYNNKDYIALLPVETDEILMFQGVFSGMLKKECKYKHSPELITVILLT